KREKIYYAVGIRICTDRATGESKAAHDLADFMCGDSLKIIRSWGNGTGERKGIAGAERSCTIGAQIIGNQANRLGFRRRNPPSVGPTDRVDQGNGAANAK